MQKILHHQNKGTITDITGPLSYKIKLTDGTEVRRHVDSIKQRLIATATAVNEVQVAQDFEGPTIESETQEITRSQLVHPHQCCRNHLNNRSY